MTHVPKNENKMEQTTHRCLAFPPAPPPLGLSAATISLYLMACSTATKSYIVLWGLRMVETQRDGERRTRRDDRIREREIMTGTVERR